MSWFGSSSRKTTLFYVVLIAMASLVVGMVIASRLDLSPTSSAQTIAIPVEPEQGAIQVHVLAPAGVRVEARPNLEHRSDPSCHTAGTRRRRDNPRDDLQQRRLASPVAPDNSEPLARVDGLRQRSRKLS